MGIKVGQLLASDGISHYAWLIFCPGCNMHHQMDSRWTYNNNPEVPTFSPSILSYGFKSSNPKYPGVPRCHSFVTDGKIKYLDDCEHNLKGQEIELPDYDD